MPSPRFHGWFRRFFLLWGHMLRADHPNWFGGKIAGYLMSPRTQRNCGLGNSNGNNPLNRHIEHRSLIIVISALSSFRVLAARETESIKHHRAQ